jgi:hypothetical protein
LRRSGTPGKYKRQSLVRVNLNSARRQLRAAVARFLKRPYADFFLDCTRQHGMLTRASKAVRSTVANDPAL